mgnify:FL=1
MSEKQSIHSLTEKRKELWDAFVHGLDKHVAAKIATVIVQTHREDEFIKSLKNLLGNPKQRLVISNSENVQFYDDCKKLADSILKVRFADKKVERESPNNIVLKKIIKLDNQISLLKKQQKKESQKR